MESFPLEIIEKIVMDPTLSINDVVNLSLTCKTFLETISNNNAVWKKKFFQKWPQLRDKLENPQICYYQEVRHVFELKRRTRAMLEPMPQKFYKNVDLSEHDLLDWDKMIKEKWDNFYYLTMDLMSIIDTKKQINSFDVVPLNTPGNLTQKYYAGKVLRHIRQMDLKRTWKRFIGLPIERQVMEIGAVIVAQWCQPNLELDPEEIFKTFDGIAERVKNLLKQDHPDHPVCKTTQEQLELWRVEVRPDNEWCPNDCRIIIRAMRVVLFEQMGFTSYTDEEDALKEADAYLNVVLQTRRGMVIPLAIIYEAVARRLGLRCEPVAFPSHFLLRFCESQHPDADWYYIDVRFGGNIIKPGVCPYSAKLGAKRRKLPMASTAEIIFSLANVLEELAEHAYSPSGQFTYLRSALELLHVIDPRDVSTMASLVKLYMQRNINVTPLEDCLLTEDFNIPEQAESLLRVLQNYCAEPPDDPVEPVNRTLAVKFAVGMVMYHLLYRYKCVIFNWDPICLAADEWQKMNQVKSLRLKSNQPFYNVLVEDGSHRYVAQENLTPHFNLQPLVLSDEVGRHFSHYCQSYYVPNAQTEFHYPEDKEVRRYFHEHLKLK